MSDKKIVFCLVWEESEKGWGTRPDGYSIHQTSQDAEEYLKEYWAKMPDETPDEYSRPVSGATYPCCVSDEEMEQLLEGNKKGLRVYGKSKPIKLGV